MKKCLYREVMRKILWWPYKLFNSMYFPLYRTRVGKFFLEIGNYFQNIRETKFDLTDEEKVELNKIANELVDEFLEEEAVKNGHKLNLIIEDSNTLQDHRKIMVLTNIISLKEDIATAWCKIKDYNFGDYYVKFNESNIDMIRKNGDRLIAKLVER